MKCTVHRNRRENPTGDVSQITARAKSDQSVSTTTQDSNRRRYFLVVVVVKD